MTENTKEHELCKRIQTSKNAWKTYEQLNTTCREHGINFLSNHSNDVFNSHLSELKILRMALCEERNE